MLNILQVADVMERNTEMENRLKMIVTHVDAGMVLCHVPEWLVQGMYFRERSAGEKSHKRLAANILHNFSLFFIYVRSFVFVIHLLN